MKRPASILLALSALAGCGLERPLEPLRDDRLDQR